MNARYLGPLPTHGRFDYTPITRRMDHAWPNGARLAVYIGFNLEHFAFGEGLGACIGPAAPHPDVLNFSWREYGNRVGAWRCLELFDSLGLVSSTLLNTALYEHCPELVAASVARGDELIGHGHSNAERQADMDESGEAALIAHCRARPGPGWAGQRDQLPGVQDRDRAGRSFHPILLSTTSLIFSKAASIMRRCGSSSLRNFYALARSWKGTENSPGNSNALS